MTLSFSDQIHVNLNLDYMFLLSKAFSNAWSTQLGNITLFGSRQLFFNMASSLSSLIVVLNVLKQKIFRGWKAWDVCEGNVTMFNPKACYCFIILMSCSSHDHLGLKMRVGLKDLTCNWPFEDINELLEQKKFIHIFFCIAMQVHGLHNLM